jgi:hypothetical protein
MELPIGYLLPPPWALGHSLYAKFVNSYLFYPWSSTLLPKGTSFHEFVKIIMEIVVMIIIVDY